MNKSRWIENLIAKFSKPLIRYATGILKDSEAAKEVVQECFLRILDHDPIELNINEQSWLYRECRNRSIDIWRKQRRIEPLSPNFDEKWAMNDPNPLQKIETNQEVTRLQVEVRKLPEKSQEILWLKYNDGLSYKEIAEVMGLSPSNVGFILHEVMKILRTSTSASEAALSASQIQRKYGE